MITDGYSLPEVRYAVMIAHEIESHGRALNDSGQAQAYAVQRRHRTVFCSCVRPAHKTAGRTHMDLAGSA